jgi:hypothetical protein
MPLIVDDPESMPARAVAKGGAAPARLAPKPGGR